MKENQHYSSGLCFQSTKVHLYLEIIWVRDFLFKIHQIRAQEVIERGRATRWGQPTHLGLPNLAPCPAASLIHHDLRKHTFKSSWALIWSWLHSRARTKQPMDWRPHQSTLEKWFGAKPTLGNRHPPSGAPLHRWEWMLVYPMGQVISP
jgi:hypothetical protein